jgi:tRNA CCA-adding enzyme
MEKNILEIEIPKKEELDSLGRDAGILLNKLEKSLKKKRITAEIFLGGSFAKGTMIKKKKYDIDIFVRFKKEGDIEKLEDSLKGAGIKAKRIHGSRDYFRVSGKSVFEIVPVLKIDKPEQAKNVTDLSFFHVSYIHKKVKKNPKLSRDIILAKTFCYAQRCYGAESYIKGFSGYALELLVTHYGSFMNFLKAVSRAKSKIIIDPSKFYKNKKEILLNLNEAKLSSPIVFVDPTFKERNALAALSEKTFLKFQKSCQDFLRRPSPKFFILKKIDEKKFNFILEAESGRQEGDVAGSKLLKFFNFLIRRAEKYFLIKNTDFEYDKKARYYLKLEKKREIMHEGPEINKVENLLAFKAKHRNVFIKNHRAYSREKINLSFPQFLDRFRKENGRVMKDMGVKSLRLAKQVK